MPDKKIKQYITKNDSLYLEWNFKRNTIQPNDYVIGSAKKVWWICSKCGHEWQCSIRSRTQRKTGCPKCALEQRIHSRQQTYISKNGSISNPLLLKEWNYKKNNGLTPNQFSYSSNKSVWWICSKCGYEWQAKISNRHFGRGCPCCSNKIVVPGKNDITTTNPELAKEWHPTKNGNLLPSNVTIGSSKKVWWICPNGHEYKASILHRGHGTNCPICNSGRQTSFAEQAIYYYIKQLFPNATNRCHTILNNNYELDIYIPTIKLAIEYDGSFWHKNEPSKLREEKKYLLCKKQNITLIRIKEDTISTPKKQPVSVNTNTNADYVLYADVNGKNANLDCIIQQIFSFIEKNYSVFKKTKLQQTFTDINIDTNRDRFKILSLFAAKKTNTIKSNPLLLQEWHPTKNEPLKPHMISLGSSEKIWWKCSICGHEWKTSVYHRTKGTNCPKCYTKNLKVNHPSKKAVLQFSLDNKLIKEWNSISDASRTLKINSSNITMCAKHQRKQAGGYHWEYKTH